MRAFFPCRVRSQSPSKQSGGFAEDSLPTFAATALVHQLFNRGGGSRFYVVTEFSCDISFHSETDFFFG